MRVTRCLVVLTATITGCVPSNQLMPLRGEDPISLELSSENHEWLEKTGASRAVEAFRASLIRREWKEAMARLGPATMSIIERHAREIGVQPEDLIKKGEVPGLGLPGTDDPLMALRLPGSARIIETSGFDPGRRKARVLVLIEGIKEAIEVPAFFTEDGWRIELVRMLDVLDNRPTG